MEGEGLIGEAKHRRFQHTLCAKDLLLSPLICDMGEEWTN